MNRVKKETCLETAEAVSKFKWVSTLMTNRALRYKRSKRDMIEIFKMMKGVFDKETCENLFEVRPDSIQGL